jgi:hypothetical protein
LAGYSSAVIFPAFYDYRQAGFAIIMAFEYTPLPLTMIGILLIVVGAA